VATANSTFLYLNAMTKAYGILFNDSNLNITNDEDKLRFIYANEMQNLNTSKTNVLIGV